MTLVNGSTANGSGARAAEIRPLEALVTWTSADIFAPLRIEQISDQHGGAQPFLGRCSTAEAQTLATVI